MINGKPTLYTCGWGYIGEGNKTNQKSAAVEAMSPMDRGTIKGKGKRAGNWFQQRMGQKTGALYTPDYMYPTDNNKSVIAWAGILTEDMLNKLTSFLSKVTFVHDSQNGTNDILEIEHNNETSGYKEFVGRGNKDYFNCLTWSVFITGAKLFCEHNDPKKCPMIENKDEWTALHNSFHSQRSADMVNANIAMQKAMSSSWDWCRECLGFGGGKRHLNKQTHRNKRKHITKNTKQNKTKKRQNKTKKQGKHKLNCR